MVYYTTDLIPYIMFFPRASIYRYVRESIKDVKIAIAYIWHILPHKVD